MFGSLKQLVDVDEDLNMFTPSTNLDDMDQIPTLTKPGKLFGQDILTRFEINISSPKERDYSQEIERVSKFVGNYTQPTFSEKDFVGQSEYFTNVREGLFNSPFEPWECECEEKVEYVGSINQIVDNMNDYAILTRILTFCNLKQIISSLLLVNKHFYKVSIEVLTTFELSESDIQMLFGLNNCVSEELFIKMLPRLRQPLNLENSDGSEEYIDEILHFCVFHGFHKALKLFLHDNTFTPRREEMLACIYRWDDVSLLEILEMGYERATRKPVITSNCIRCFAYTRNYEALRYLRETYARSPSLFMNGMGAHEDFQDEDYFIDQILLDPDHSEENSKVLYELSQIWLKGKYVFSVDSFQEKFFEYLPYLPYEVLWFFLTTKPGNKNYFLLPDEVVDLIIGVDVNVVMTEGEKKEIVDLIFYANYQKNNEENLQTPRDDINTSNPEQQKKKEEEEALLAFRNRLARGITAVRKRMEVVMDEGEQERLLVEDPEPPAEENEHGRIVEDNIITEQVPVKIEEEEEEEEESEGESEDDWEEEEVVVEEKYEDDWEEKPNNDEESSSSILLYFKERRAVQQSYVFVHFYGRRGYLEDFVNAIERIDETLIYSRIFNPIGLTEEFQQLARDSGKVVSVRPKEMLNAVNKNENLEFDLYFSNFRYFKGSMDHDIDELLKVAIKSANNHAFSKILSIEGYRPGREPFIFSVRNETNEEVVAYLGLKFFEGATQEYRSIRLDTVVNTIRNYVHLYKSFCMKLMKMEEFVPSPYFIASVENTPELVNLFWKLYSPKKMKDYMSILKYSIQNKNRDIIKKVFQTPTWKECYIIMINYTVTDWNDIRSFVQMFPVMKRFNVGCFNCGKKMFLFKKKVYWGSDVNLCYGCSKGKNMNDFLERSLPVSTRELERLFCRTCCNRRNGRRYCRYCTTDVV